MSGVALLAATWLVHTFLKIDWTGLHMLNFWDQLPSLLEDVPLATRQRLIFQHDGAPPHYHHQVKQHLDQVYPDKWIGRGGPRQWPARSPDLTPLDYYLWGHMKTLVYKKKSNTREELLQRIMEACQDIRDKPDVLRESASSILKRAQLCIEQGGNHFENLMWWINEALLVCKVD